MIDLSAKAKTLVRKNTAFGAIVVASSLCAAHANAGIIDGNDLTLEEMSVGYLDSGGFPGFFSSEASDDGNIVGEAFGDGLKLYGSASMSDTSLFTSHSNPDPDGESASFVSGIAFNWTGTFSNPDDIAIGDQLALAYDFGIDFTDNLSQETSVSYRFSTGFFNLATGPIFTTIWDKQEILFSGKDDITGSAESGNVDTDILDGIQDGQTGWFVRLLVEWQDFSSFDDPIDVDNIDTLSVIIPNNSIDIGLNVAPTGTTVPVPEPSSLFILVSGLLGGLLSTRRKKA